MTIELKRKVTSENVNPLILQMHHRRRDKTILFSDYINPAVSKLLRDQEINFADPVGNIYLNDPPLFVWQQGFKPETTSPRPTRLLQTVGLKILSVLLWEPQAVNNTYREIAHRAGASLGAVTPVFDDLAKGGYLNIKKGKRQLTRQRELLDQWVLGYAGQLFPRLFLKTYRLAQDRPIESLADQMHWARFAESVLLGGELAAGLATAYLRPTRATIHLPAEDQGTWIKHLKLIPDPQGNVDLVERFAKGNQWEEPPAALEGIRCASPVLLYGELLRVGADERLKETAEMIFEKFIEPRWHVA